MKPVWVLLLVSAALLATSGTQAYWFYLQSVQGISDTGGQALGRDFAGFWTMVVLLKAGGAAAVYSQTLYTAKLTELFHVYGQPWVYPPQYLFIAWPFTFITSYKTAYAVWSASNALILALVMFWRSPLTLSWKFIVLFAPCLLLTLFLGQNGLLTAACLIGGFRLLKTCPWLAGICFGLLAVKPQLGILIPFILLALAQYRAIGSAALTLCVLVVASGVAFGWQSWADFFANAWHMQSAVAHLISQEMISLSAALQSLGWSLTLSRMLQAFITLGLGVLVCVRLYRIRDAHWTQWLRIALPAIYLVTPYLFIYDVCALSVALIFWLSEQGQKKVWLPGTLIWLALWYAPFMCASLNKTGSDQFPFIPFLLLAAFACAWLETKPEKAA